MIDYIFGNFLLSYMHKKVVYEKDELNKLAIVMVATKPYFWSSLVIKNALDKIKPCNFYFYGSKESVGLMKLQINYPIKYRTVDDLIEIKSYNKLMLNPIFWSEFKEEYILIIQPDCILLRNIECKDFKFDYIGAICGNFDENFIINGGLSLRKRDVMIDICNNLSPEEKSGSIAEDVIFSKKIKNNVKYSCPSLDDCHNFSIEYQGLLNNVLGIHGTDKYYIHPKIKHDFAVKYLKNKKNEITSI